MQSKIKNMSPKQKAIFTPLSTTSLKRNKDVGKVRITINLIVLAILDIREIKLRESYLQYQI